MNSLGAFFHITLADFQERAKSYGYLGTLILTILAAFIFVRLVDAGFVVMQFGRYRSINNINYIWTAVVANESLLLSLVGFYLAKNSIDKDERTTTGQIIAATPTTKVTYIVGKAASNFFVLLSIILVLAIVVSIMFLFRFKNIPFNALTLYSTYFLFILPPVIFVSAAAILFETIPFLRRGLGNIVYFFIWAIVFVAIIADSTTNNRIGTGIHSLFDLAGFSFFYQSMLSSAQASFSNYAGTSYNMLKVGAGNVTEAFVWNGIQWTTEIILCRLFILIFAGILLALASLIFNRFDSKQKIKKGIQEMMPQALPQLFSLTKATASAPVKLSALNSAKRFVFFQLVLSEIRLMLKGTRWWWFTVAAGLWITGLCTPVNSSRDLFISNLTWIWPALLWSSMGAREKQSDTRQVIFSCAHPVSRQIPALWVSGLIIAFLTGTGLGIRFILEGNWGGLFAWSAGIIFVPTLALALGTLSGTSKVFEALYLMIWYLGPVNRIAIFDYTGTTQGIDLITQPLIYICAAMILFWITVLTRRRQVFNL